jgi:hypothetical protein
MYVSPNIYAVVILSGSQMIRQDAGMPKPVVVQGVGCSRAPMSIFDTLVYTWDVN